MNTCHCRKHTNNWLQAWKWPPIIYIKPELVMGKHCPYLNHGKEYYPRITVRLEYLVCISAWTCNVSSSCNLASSNAVIGLLKLRTTQITDDYLILVDHETCTSHQGGMNSVLLLSELHLFHLNLCRWLYIVQQYTSGRRKQGGWHVTSLTQEKALKYLSIIS